MAGGNAGAARTTGVPNLVAPPYALPPGDGRTDTDVTTFLANNADWNVMDFGALGDGVTNDTAAFQAAMSAASNAGGGIVKVPAYVRGQAKVFLVSQLTFAGLSHVMLEGMAPAFNYGNAPAVSTLKVLTGVWGVRFTADSSYCGMRNIGLISNGALSFTPPHPITTAGVEYGVIIETGSTLMQQCTVYGFQYGTALISGGNSNVFDQVTWDWNTLAGFVCTFGSAGCYAAYHPNLVAPVSPLATTVYTIRDCKFRRNGWGIIMRDGGPHLEGVNVVEANFFGGLILAVGDLDSGVGVLGHIYLEANWLLYDATAAYTITQNNCLKNTAGTWLPWTSAVPTATNDAGYQLYSVTSAAKNGVNDGPGYCDFLQPTLVCGSAGATPGKGMYLKQASFWRLFNGSCTGGDQPNAVRIGAAGWSVNAVHIWDWNGTLPALSGTGINRVAGFQRDRTGVGGIVCTQGAFQNCGGTFSGTTGVFSSTLNVTGITTVNGVTRMLGVGAAAVGAAGFRLGDTNSGSSRDWAITNGISATGVSQIGVLAFSVSTALSGDPLTAGTEIVRLTSSGLQVTTGTIKMSVAASQLVPGATSFSHRNSANNADNLIILDAGDATFRTSLKVTTGFGCNGAAPQTAVASGGALAAYVTGAFGLDSTAHMQAMFNLVVAMRAALVANGIMS